MGAEFSIDAKKVMQLANQEAVRLNHETVDAEHIMVGLIKANSGRACKVLDEWQIKDRLLKKIRDLMPEGFDVMTLGRLPLAPRAESVVRRAGNWQARLGRDVVEPDDLLLALMDNPCDVLATIIPSLGCSIGAVRERLLRKSDATNLFVEFQIAEPKSNVVEQTWELLSVSATSSFVAVFFDGPTAWPEKQSRQVELAAIGLARCTTTHDVKGAISKQAENVVVGLRLMDGKFEIVNRQQGFIGLGLRSSTADSCASLQDQVRELKQVVDTV